MNFKNTQTEIRNCIVFASYKEFENLEILLSEISNGISKETLLLVCDDSGIIHQEEVKKHIDKALCDKNIPYQISFASNKSGRGSAIRRGFSLAIESYDNIEYLIECDSDGSHRAEDIIKLLVYPECDFLIGSRYLRQSRIYGWPISRKIASKILNSLIPRILGVPCKDLTNGLRRYSKEAVKSLLSEPIRNSGFIYLSEQAMQLTKNNFEIVEIPIHFVNRLHGESSVGFIEIRESLLGVWSLWKNRKET